MIRGLIVLVFDLFSSLMVDKRINTGKRHRNHPCKKNLYITYTSIQVFPEKICQKLLILTAVFDAPVCSVISNLLSSATGGFAIITSKTF